MPGSSRGDTIAGLPVGTPKEFVQGTADQGKGLVVWLA